MTGIKTSLCVALLSLALHSGGAASCDSKKPAATRNDNQSAKPNATQTPTPAPDREKTVSDEKIVNDGGNTVSDEIKVLSEGGYSQVQNAFVIVARDATTYQALREIVKGLPELSADSFEKQAVVAAFLGQRRTGGYGVNITRGADKSSLRLVQQSPPQGGMTTQALTAPFKVVAVPLRPDDAVRLELDGAWQTALRPYNVTAGEFTMAGGFAGRQERFGMKGTLGIMRQDKLATMMFDLQATEAKKPRELKGAATALVQNDGSINLPYLDPGTFVDKPRGALQAKGKFNESESNLSLDFTTLPTIVADDFNGQGKLEANATAPPKQTSKPKEM